MMVEIKLIVGIILDPELHISESQKQKCLTFSLIFISLHPLAVFMPIALAFISSSLVKHLRLAGVSIFKKLKYLIKNIKGLIFK